MDRSSRLGASGLLRSRLTAVLWALAYPAATWAAPARLAIVVGENRGLAGDAQLRFAESDARKMAKALIDLGGFAPGEVHTLLSPSAADLRARLAGLASSPERA